MSIDISRKNEARLRAGAEAEGVAINDYLDRVLSEREELVASLERGAARMPRLPREEIRAKIERGFLQSESGEVEDGEAFYAEIAAELDDLERKRRTG